MIDPLNFIEELNNTDPSFKTIFMYGSCYRFHQLLKSLYGTATPLINKEKNHVITQIEDKFYDITGEVDSIGFQPLDDSDFHLVQSWSFHKHMLMSLGDCPNCDEPILTRMDLY